MTETEKKQRLSAQERKKAILESAIPLFAENGFKATTTRDIAKAANVSEALLYKYFPSKVALYKDLSVIACSDKEDLEAKIDSLQSSTFSLVLITYLMTSAIVRGDFLGNNSDEVNNFRKLMVHSCLDDGTFAAEFLLDKVQVWRSKFSECLDAALKSGDLISNNIEDMRDSLWFVHHLSVGTATLNFNSNVVNYSEKNEEARLDQMICFSLRGLGLKEEAIKTHYNRSAFDLLLKR